MLDRSSGNVFFVPLVGSLLAAAGGACGEPSTDLAALNDRQLNVTFRSDASGEADAVWVTVSSHDVRSNCLKLDSGTEFEVGGRREELGDPNSQGEDDCPDEAVAFFLDEGEIDRSSPTSITVSDASATMKMSVRDMFQARQLVAPTAISGCTTFELEYTGKGDVLRTDRVLADFTLPGTAPRHIVGLSVASAAGTIIRLSVPFVAPGDPMGEGTLSVDVRAGLAIENCAGATLCSAEADTRFEASLILSDCSR